MQGSALCWGYSRYSKELPYMNIFLSWTVKATWIQGRAGSSWSAVSLIWCLKYVPESSSILRWRTDLSKWIQGMHFPVRIVQTKMWSEVGERQGVSGKHLYKKENRFLEWSITGSVTACEKQLTFSCLVEIVSLCLTSQGSIFFLLIYWHTGSSSVLTAEM